MNKLNPGVESIIIVDKNGIVASTEGPEHLGREPEAAVGLEAWASRDRVGGDRLAAGGRRRHRAHSPMQ